MYIVYTLRMYIVYINICVHICAYMRTYFKYFNTYKNNTNTTQIGVAPWLNKNGLSRISVYKN